MTDALVEALDPIDVHGTISVVDADELVRGVLAEHVGGLPGGAAAYQSVADYCEATDGSHTGVVVFGPSADPDEVIASIEGLASSRPGCGAVMVVNRLTAHVLQAAMRAGVDDVVAASAEDDELLAAILRASARGDARVPAPAAPVEEPVPDGDRARVVTVFCTKGGSGKSVLATNLAVALARRTIQPVVLVDADLQFGDVALMLQLQPVHTIAEAAHAGDRLDGTLLESLLLRDQGSGLYVLAAPTESGSADGIGRDHLLRVIGVLRQRCAFVVIDTSSNFAEISLAALEVADDILVLAGLDVMSLKSARVGLQTMRVLDIPTSRVRFVLNRANTRVGLTEADAERALQLKIDTALPSDIVVAESVNRGVPVVSSAPRTKFAKAVDDLAGRLMAAAPVRDAQQS